MGIRPYIDDDLAAGRLVAPFALSVPKGMRWYLVYRELPHRAARLCRVPALDHPRRGRARRTPQGSAPCRLKQIDTLVIGGGQAGLVMSYRLKQRGLPHLVLERARIAERWRSERWDGLKFQFPNWSVRLPDFPFPHTEPDAFATSAEIVDFIDAFAAFAAPPIRCGVEVTRLARGDARLHRRDRERNDRSQKRRGRHRPLSARPDAGPVARSPVFQVHADSYRNPGHLPPGAVLVVGAGASGAQIAEELNRAGRRVFLAVGEHTRMPRRYRGQDLTWWFGALRLFQMTPEQRTHRVNPSITAPMAATPSTSAASPPTASR